MSDTQLQAQADAARAYERLFVPALFAQWATLVANETGVRSGQRALDVACGTGVLTRVLLARCGAAGHVAGIDASAGMLAVARELAPSVEWQHGTAEALPFESASFDAVASQFGLMFFSDRAQALREMLRVMRPAGRLVVAVWDALETMPVFAAEDALLYRMAGAAAAEALRAPFVLGDRDQLGVLFREAGAVNVAVATHSGTAHFPSVRTLVEADVRGWLPMMGVSLGDEQVEAILAAGESELAPHVDASGQLVFEVRAHVVTAGRPTAD